MKAVINGVLTWIGEAGGLFIAHLAFLGLGVFVHVCERTHHSFPFAFDPGSPLAIAYLLSAIVIPALALSGLIARVRRLSHLAAHVGMSIAQFVAILPLVQ